MIRRCLPSSHGILTPYLAVDIEEGLPSGGVTSTTTNTPWPASLSMVISILSHIQSTLPHPAPASSSPPCTPSLLSCSSELSLFSMSLGDPRMLASDASLPSSGGLSTPSSRSRRLLRGSVSSAISALPAVLPRALPLELSLPARPREIQTVRQNQGIYSLTRILTKCRLVHMDA